MPRRHVAGGDPLLDGFRPRTRLIICDERHRSHRAFTMTVLTFFLEDRGDVFGKGWGFRSRLGSHRDSRNSEANQETEHTSGRAIYRSLVIPCAGQQIYSLRHRPWLEKLREASVDAADQDVRSHCCILFPHVLKPSPHVPLSWKTLHIRTAFPPARLWLSHRRRRGAADNSQRGYRHAYDTQTSLGKSPLIEQVSAFATTVSMIRNDHPAASCRLARRSPRQYARILNRHQRAPVSRTPTP